MLGFLAITGVGLAVATPAGAQIASYVDADGKRVFVNAEPAAMRRAAARSAAAPAPRRGPSGAVLPDRAALQQMARETAERHKLDPALVGAVIRAESNWNPLAVSSKGAQGLMQLMPATAAQLGVRDPFDPQQNLDGGVRHLRALLERYNGNLDRALAAYNAGEGAVERAGGVPRFAETVAYVQKITDAYFRPDSGRGPELLQTSRRMYRIIDDRGRVVYTTE